MELATTHVRLFYALLDSSQGPWTFSSVPSWVSLSLYLSFSLLSLALPPLLDPSVFCLGFYSLIQGLGDKFLWTTAHKQQKEQKERVPDGLKAITRQHPLGGQ